MLFLSTENQDEQDLQAEVTTRDASTHPGPPWPFFGRQGRHSGGHISGMPPLPPQLSIRQNPGKA